MKHLPGKGTARGEPHEHVNRVVCEGLAALSFFFLSQGESFPPLLSVPSQPVSLLPEECQWLTYGVSGVGSSAYCPVEEDSVTVNEADNTHALNDSTWNFSVWDLSTST